MTDGAGDNAVFAQMLARRHAEKADKLAQAKREAAERGKQPFDLDKLEKLYATSTDGGGYLAPRAEREREFEYRYYVDYPQTMSIAEYAAKQSAIDAGADPRPPSDPAEVAARANTVLARVPASFANLTEAGAAQARRDLEEVIGHLEALVALIPAGAERVPDSAFGTYTAKRWSELYPERFERAALSAALADERRRLAELDSR
ncbi:MAG TPA: hypothetical protein VML75_12910 [Kofleriaceae bacterium]|nr:hypothetical protein [Kofleriaceae bacterium]